MRFIAKVLRSNNYFHVSLYRILPSPLSATTYWLSDVYLGFKEAIHVFEKTGTSEVNISNSMADDKNFSLLMSNLHMDNEDKEKFMTLVRDYDPDILLINESNEEWKMHSKSWIRIFVKASRNP